MNESSRKKDEIYKAVSNFYKNKRLDKWKFIKRLKLIHEIIDGEHTMNSAVNWIYTTEEIEFCNDFTNDEVKRVKKAIRDELQEILLSLDFKASKASRNQ